MEKLGQHIAAEPVGCRAAATSPGKAAAALVGNGLRIAGKEQRRDERHGKQRGQDDGAGDGLRSAQKAAERAHAPASLAPTRGSRKA